MAACIEIVIGEISSCNVILYRGILLRAEAFLIKPGPKDVDIDKLVITINEFWG